MPIFKNPNGVAVNKLRGEMVGLPVHIGKKQGNKNKKNNTVYIRNPVGVATEAAAASEYSPGTPNSWNTPKSWNYYYHPRSYFNPNNKFRSNPANKPSTLKRYRAKGPNKRGETVNPMFLAHTKRRSRVSNVLGKLNTNVHTEKPTLKFGGKKTRRSKGQR